MSAEVQEPGPIWLQGLGQALLQEQGLTWLQGLGQAWLCWLARSVLKLGGWSGLVLGLVVGGQWLLEPWQGEQAEQAAWWPENLRGLPLSIKRAADLVWGDRVACCVQCNAWRSSKGQYAATTGNELGAFLGGGST